MSAPIRTVAVSPFEGQRPGTSGLRKSVRVFQQPGYAETFLQSVFDGIDGRVGATLVVGGDGRFFNAEVIQIALRMAAANGFERAVVGRAGLLSTPAASHLIRLRGAAGGLIMSASHNAGGPAGDFGIKYNVASGGPAPEPITEAIYASTQSISHYLTVEAPDVPLDVLGETRIGGMVIEVVDPVADYATLMESLFDFDAIRASARRGFTIRFDAMNAVTGPYAVEILERRLGFAPGSVVGSTPLADFGGRHPDPNLVHAKNLYELMMSSAAPDFGAASDGDGDRNLVIGRGRFVSPSDALAILAANAHLTPGYARGLKGIARSMPTSAAADRVARALAVPLYETPTGWKYFGNLLDAGLATICGEESAGVGSDHVREKDGLWAVLLWLNILAVRGTSVDALVRAHWAEFGRDLYARHDYEGVSALEAEALMSNLRERVDGLAGVRAGPLTVERADDFTYQDPVDGSASLRQGVRIFFQCDARAVLRLSGTGTSGATLRVYLERYVPPSGKVELGDEDGLAEVAAAAEALADICRRIGRAAPDVIT